MSAAQNINIYLNNHYEGMTPEKLIHLLYKAALEHLDFARVGVVEKNPKKRGEHLSKVIAIVSELNISIDPKINDESTQFLRGLYTSMLAELSKVSITNDVKTIDLTIGYLKKLNEIWETQVLKTPQKEAAPLKIKPVSQGRYNSGNVVQPKSIFV